MPSPGGAAATGAVAGAGTGAAVGSVVPVIGTAIGAGVGAIVGGVGGYLSASGTSEAQAAQNKAAAQNAASQSSQAWQNYLASRGINIQQLIAQFPDIQRSYQEALARGDKRDFDTWVYAALKAAPNHPIWNAIANPAGTAGAANTTLPAWAVGPDGKPLQPELLAQILGINSGAANPATAPAASIATVQNAHAFLQANPQVVQELMDAGVGTDGRSMEQWLVDHITTTEAQSGGGTFTDALRGFLTTPVSQGGGAVAPGGPAGTGANTTLDPAIAGLIPRATETLGGVFDGTYLKQILDAQKPVADFRQAEAEAQAAKINEQRRASGTILDTELAGIGGVTGARTAGAAGVYDAASNAASQVYQANVAKLADLLGIRKEAAQQIYDATVAGAGGVKDAKTTGAKDIYGQELLRADTYGQAANQALNRLLAQQGAERARRGFTGGSSGSDIVSARLMADYLQRGAGERATAGVNLAGRTADANVGYATETGKAGVGRATTIGQSNEADAAAKLAAAVDLAKSLGLAGVNRATTLAGTGEQAAIAQLQAKVADATRRLSYLTADGDIAKANADLKNAQDALAAITSDQSRKIGAVGAPFSLAGLDLGLKKSLNDQQYTGIDSLLARLNSFTTNPASGPGLTTTTPGPVLNNSQILGGTLTGLGSTVSNASSNAELMALIKSLNLGSTTPAPTKKPDNLDLMGSGTFLGGSSVFPGPG